MVIKDFVNWADTYFQNRENFVKETNKAEFIWIWNHHNRIVSEIMQNKNIVDINSRVPKDEDYETFKLNEFNVVHYKFEETNKEKIKDDILSKPIEDKKKV